MEVQAITENDATDVLRITSELARTSNPSIEGAQQFIEGAKQFINILNREGCAFKLVVDGYFAGGVTLKTTKYTHCAEIGFWVAKLYQRKGIASAGVSHVIQHAFSEQRYKRIFGWCSSRNSASARVMEKAGMQREGILRNHLFAEGTYLDAHYYGVLADSAGRTER